MAHSDAATREQTREQTHAGVGQNATALGGIEALTPLAGKGDWLGWLRAASLLIASLLTLAALVCFIAFNWQDLGRVARASLVALGMLASGGLSAWVGPASPARGPLLLLTFGLIGTLMAVVGQLYQLGADSHLLYFNWGLFALPLVVVSRAQIVWLAWLVVWWLAVFLAPRSSLLGWLVWFGDPMLFNMMVAGLLLAARQVLLQRFAWMRPSLVPGAVALAAVVQWFPRFWLLLAPNWMVETAMELPALLVWLVLSLILAAGLIGSAFWRREALLTFVGVFWAAGALAALGFRLALTSYGDGPLNYITVTGLVLVLCFLGASFVMRAWLRRFGNQDRSAAQMVANLVQQTSHWSVTTLRSVAGLLGGAVLTLGVIGPSIFFSESLAGMLGVGILLTAVALIGSARVSKSEPSGLSGMHVFLFVLLLDGLGFVLFSLTGDPFSQASKSLGIAFLPQRLVLLSFFVAAGLTGVWRPGQVLLLILAMAAWLPELGRLASLTQINVALMALVAATHIWGQRWSSLRYLQWGLILVTLASLELALLIETQAANQAELLEGAGQLLGFQIRIDGYWQQRILALLGYSILAAVVLRAIRPSALQERQALPYVAALVVLAAVLPTMAGFALMLMLAGRDRQRMGLEVFGWLVLLVALNQWYASLGLTLLIKAGYLAMSAAVAWLLFAAARWHQRRQRSADPQPPGPQPPGPQPPGPQSTNEG